MQIFLFKFFYMLTLETHTLYIGSTLNYTTNIIIIVTIII